MDITDNTLDFNKICRLCLTEETVMSSIYNEDDTETNSVPLPLRIMSCVSVEVSSNDGLPSQICATCLCQVDGWYKFKDLCENSDLLLRKCIKNEPVQIDSISQVRTMAQEVKKYFSSQVIKDESEAANQNKNLSPKKKMTFLSDRWPTESSFIRRAKEIVALSKIKEINFDAVPKKPECSSSSEGEEICEEKDDDNDETFKTDPSHRKYFVCNCNKKYQSKYQLEIHQEFRCTVAQYDEPIIEEDNTSDDETYVKRVKQKQVLYVCGCNKCFSSKENLEKHKEAGYVDDDWLLFESEDEDGNVNYICECKEKLVSIDAFREHIKRGKCKEYVKINEKYEVKKDKFGRKVYSCQTCSRTFCVKSLLMKHIANKKCKLPDANAHKGYPCPECGEVFYHKPKLRRHISINHPPEYKCEHCTKKFANITALKNHKTMVHKDGFSKYVCEYCAKKFLGSQPLKIHLRKHTNERPYQCEYCDKKFSIKRSLTMHVEFQHFNTGEKNFVCDVCGVAFARKEYLQVHANAHRDERKFRCEHCGATFRWKGGKRKHILKKHRDKIKLYTCKFCEKQFQLEKNCMAHMEEHMAEFTKPIS